MRFHIQLASSLALALALSACASTSVIHKYYWADVQKGTAVVDLITLSPEHSEKASEYSQTAQLPPDVMAQDAPCIPETDVIPAEMLPIGTKLSLLTENGPVETSVKGHCAQYGAGENHWLVFLSPQVTTQAAELLVAAPGAFPKDAALKRLPEDAPLSPQDIKLAESLRPRLCTDPIPELLVPVCQKLTFDNKTTQVVRGNFGGGYNALVFLLWRIEEPEGYASIELYSAWFAVNEATGAVLELSKPEQSIYYNWGDYIGDVDGDGIDEVIYSSAYYEGHYYLLLDWDAAQPDFQMLTGDGA